MTLKSCQHFAKNKAFVNEFEMRPRGLFPAIFLLFTSIDVNDLDWRQQSMCHPSTNDDSVWVCQIKINIDLYLSRGRDAGVKLSQ